MKILQVTDLHLGTFPYEKDDLKTVKLVKKLIEKNEPDLIAFTGDVICSASTQALDVFKNFVKLMDSFKIPFAMTFGNHDSERSLLNYYIENFERVDKNTQLAFREDEKLKKYMKNYMNLKNFTREDLFKILKKSKHHVKVKNEHISSDKISYFIDIDNFRLIFLDSGSYDKTSFGYYEYLSLEQIDWLEEIANEKKSFIFCHLPLREYGVARDLGLAEGHQKEIVCSGGLNTGCYARLNFKTKTKAIFCGHDHNNDFSAKYGNIYLTYGRVTGYSAYGNLIRGGRIIEIKDDYYNSYIVEGKK